MAPDELEARDDAREQEAVDADEPLGFIARGIADEDSTRG